LELLEEGVVWRTKSAEEDYERGFNGRVVLAGFYAV